IDADQLCDAVSKLQIEGIKVRPIHFTPNMSKHVGEACHGIEIFVRDHQAFKPVRAGYRILNVIRNLYPDFKFLPPWKEGQNQMIDLLTGSQDLKLNKDEALIFEGFKKDEEAFKASIEGYRLYE